MNSSLVYRPWLLYALLGASLTMNLVMALKWPKSDTHTPEPEEQGRMEPPTPAAEVARPSAAAPAERSSPPATARLPEADLSYVGGEIERNLSYTFSQLLGPEADAVAAVFSRHFAWDMDLRKDLQRGDWLGALYRYTSPTEIHIPLAVYDSKKLGRTLAVYEYQLAGDRHPSHWYADGTEVPRRLVNGPIEDYVQVTALLDDRVGHKGWDFKADVGTDVVSPKAGKVVRENWSWTGNGNCLDVKFNDGVNGYFLHLDENLVKPGDSVQAGQIIARSGNTGRSTAPHLHYQVQRGGAVLDPADYHGTRRRSIPEATMASFQAEVARLDALLAQATGDTRTAGL